ncbi:hypothetical protein D917_09707, partial [Trichinella nativa]
MKKVYSEFRTYLKMNENDQEIIEIGSDSSVDNFSDDQTVSSDEFKINEEDYLTWRKNALLLYNK